MSIPRKAPAILEVQKLANDLPVGGDTRVVCPRCNGGGSGERSMTISRLQPTRAHFTCWRATCDMGNGIVSLTKVNGELLTKGKDPRTATSKQISIPSIPLTDRHRAYLRRFLRLDDAMIAYGHITSVQDGRICYGIFSPQRRRCGKVVRLYKEMYIGHSETATIPKALNQMFSDTAIPMSWYYKGRQVKKQTDTLVLVEDIPSALRLNPYVDSAALLGTSFGPEKQKIVNSRRYGTVYLALDADASRRAAKIKMTQNTNVRNLKVKFLNKDIKNMKDDELQNFLKEILPNEYQHTTD